MPDNTEAADSEQADVLLVGATPRDARIIASGFARAGATLEVAPDVRTAIDRLAEGSEDPDRSGLPRLVAIDLSSDTADGLTVLHAITSSPRLRTLPTVTVLDDDIDRRRVYERGANGHVRKPAGVEAYADAVQQVASFWFDCVSLPPE